MAKIATDLEQSKILAKILPHESADMNYWCGTQIRIGGHRTMDKDLDIPCWSLAALLDIIKKLVGYSLQSLDTHTVFMNCELGDKPYNIETKNYDNPIDACYEMIIRLNELKML